MKPSKAYILRIDDPVSHEYANQAAKSCEDIGLDWEFFDGYFGMSLIEAWDHTGLYPKNLERYRHIDIPHGPMCCSAGHVSIWKLIAERNECAVILEHDSLMLHPIDIDIPNDRITVLGYKLRNPSTYDHRAAGKPTRVLELDAHEGAHAYALTHLSAQFLLDEIVHRGALGVIDNAYFIKDQRRSYLPLAILDPTPAICWVRKSTLWDESSDKNYEFIDSFKNNLGSTRI